MAKAIIMPKLGQSEETVTIVRWRKQVGDAVAKGDILFEIETDKSVLEVESFYAGTLLRILAREGVTVPVQTTVAFVGELGEPIPDVEPVVVRRPEAKKAVAAALAAAPSKGQPAAPAPKSITAPQLPFSSVSSLSPPVLPPAFKISPRAAKLAEEAAIDTMPISGTGPGGRIVERDVRQYLEQRGYARLRITPTAKNLARREGIDVLDLARKEDGSPITVADIETFLGERPKPLTGMRQIIAHRLLASYSYAPHFFVTVSADVTELETLRAESKAQGAAYTITDFILKAAALALEQFPTVNATSDGEHIRMHSKIHLGLAVALDEGLVVPVIRNANELTLAEIHARAQELTAKARARKLTPADMTGSTFTISNLGMMDVENFTAIINLGEGAILAVASVMKQPVARNDQIVIRSIMKMTLSSDHRLIDGALAARFLNAIKKSLEEKSLWQRSIS